MQRLRVAIVAVLVGMPTLALASTTGLRNIFLNGIDISSAKSQDLKHVDVHISESGDIFLVAPHYQVNEEDSFVPLSRYVQGLSQPTHQPAQKMESTVQAQPGPAAPAANPMSAAVTAAPTDNGAAESAVTPASSPAPEVTPPSKNGLLPKAGSPVAPNGAGKPGALAAGAPSAVPASPPPSSPGGQDVGNESAAGPVGDSAATPK
ncbi:MAG: hypothetical protein NTY08_01655 [Proteobacteria bacterium]|nr:hypothetical protein [Pseudomonadota bacterium]